MSYKLRLFGEKRTLISIHHSNKRIHCCLKRLLLLNLMMLYLLLQLLSRLQLRPLLFGDLHGVAIIVVTGPIDRVIGRWCDDLLLSHLSLLRREVIVIPLIRAAAAALCWSLLVATTAATFTAPVSTRFVGTMALLVVRASATSLTTPPAMGISIT